MGLSSTTIRHTQKLMSTNADQSLQSVIMCCWTFSFESRLFVAWSYKLNLHK